MAISRGSNISEILFKLVSLQCKFRLLTASLKKILKRLASSESCEITSLLSIRLSLGQFLFLPFY